MSTSPAARTTVTADGSGAAWANGSATITARWRGGVFKGVPPFIVPRVAPFAPSATPHATRSDRDGS